MTIENLILMGPGESLSNKIADIKRLSNAKTIALHRVFPYISSLTGYVPDYWTWADPDACIEGLKYILENKEKNPSLKNIKIVIPDFITGTYQYFRRFSGTTPLGKDPSLWQKYLTLLNQVSLTNEIKIVPSTTSKNICLEPSNNLDYANGIFQDNMIFRFTGLKTVFGSVKYDSDRVVGTHNRWPLENKVSSHMFPLAYYLQAKNVYCVGFDFIGGRFYDSNKSRHAWGTDVSIDNLSDGIKFSLSLIEEWVLAKEVHQMNIKCLTSSDESLLNLVMPDMNTSNIL